MSKNKPIKNHARWTKEDDELMVRSVDSCLAQGMSPAEAYESTAKVLGRGTDSVKQRYVKVTGKTLRRGHAPVIKEDASFEEDKSFPFKEVPAPGSRLGKAWTLEEDQWLWSFYYRWIEKGADPRAIYVESARRLGRSDRGTDTRISLMNTGKVAHTEAETDNGQTTLPLDEPQCQVPVTESKQQNSSSPLNSFELAMKAGSEFVNKLEERVLELSTQNQSLGKELREVHSAYDALQQKYNVLLEIVNKDIRAGEAGKVIPFVRKPTDDSNSDNKEQG